MPRAGRLAVPLTPMNIAVVRERRGSRRWWLSALSIAVVAAVFGFALPQLASYRGVWADLSSMSWQRMVLVAGVGVGNLVTCWIMIVVILPSLRLREAAVFNLGGTAVANTVPAGEAVALGVGWAMLSSWGIGTGEYVLYKLVSGVFNIVAKLALPILAFAILALTGRPGTGLVAGAVIGLVVLVLGATGLGLVRYGGSKGVRRALEGLLTAACRLSRRPPPQRLGPRLADFHRQASALLAVRGGRIVLATAMTHLSLALVLFTCLYANGVTQAQVSWQTTLAAFAFARLLSALPITPGGLGIVELGLTGVLSAGLDAPTLARVTAAVLLFRAVTYLLPIPLGAAAYLVWQTNATWRMSGQARTALRPSDHMAVLR
jgi:uncharacterized protein (TIRG00374 family)